MKLTKTVETNQMFFLDMKTFFISGRQGDNVRPKSEEKSVFRSPANSSSPVKNVSLSATKTHQSLPVSPVHSHSPVNQQHPHPIRTAESLHSYYQRRDRVYSCHVTRPTRPSTYLALTPLETKASSLPSILDSGLSCISINTFLCIQ